MIGGFHEMCELLENLSIPLKGIIDSREMSDRCCEQYPVLGDDNWLLTQKINATDQHLVISPDEPKIREKLYHLYKRVGFKFPVITGSKISEYSVIGEGSVIQQLAYVSADCKLGIATKVNVGAKVMHDAKIGDFTTIAPAAVVLGNVTIGKRVYIGANATILPNIVIADDAIVGAGSVVTKNVDIGKVVKGIPAK